MYVWIGCKLPEELEAALRRQCLKWNETIGLDTAAFALPQHISLKISFPTHRIDEVLNFLDGYLSRQRPFDVKLLPPQREGNVLWLPVAENDVLQQLHRQLDQLLQQHFGIGQHRFDKCFQFHSTLFLDTDASKLEQMEKALSSLPVPGKQQIDTFLLGTSETGTPGSYCVVRQICVSQ